MSSHAPDLVQLAASIKLWGRELGFQQVGIASIDLGEHEAHLQRWLDAGTLSRFGVVVRHHEFGFDANAMTVFDVPDDLVDARGAALACADGVTLAYRRVRAPEWRYNLYCMVHGRDRDAVLAVIARLTESCGLADYPRRVLFSRRRFKQTGPRRFRALPPGCNDVQSQNESAHAHARRPAPDRPPARRLSVVRAALCRGRHRARPG